MTGSCKGPIHGIVQYCFASLPSTDPLSFATSLPVFLLQCNPILQTLDQRSLLFVDMNEFSSAKRRWHTSATNGGCIALSIYQLENGRHVAELLCRRHRAYAPTSNIANRDNQKKIHSWVSFSFRYGYGAPLGGPSSGHSFALTYAVL